MFTHAGLPRILGRVDVAHSGVRISSADKDCEILSDGHNPADVANILSRMDGKTRLSTLASTDSSLSVADVAELIGALDHEGLIDDDEQPDSISGQNLILEIEDLVEKHSERTIQRNPFWAKCLSVAAPGDLPERLAIGMVIENWHFLFRESYFDAPVLSYVSNTGARLEMNRFFSEEYGHDEILLRSLNSVGISRGDMMDAIPLPETMALCNALAFWAHTDPLFFFTTLGLLEGQALETDSFIDACERAHFKSEFVEPLRTHSNINVNAGHGNLTRELFAHLPSFSLRKAAEMKAQVPLFVELYDNFYAGVWRYYMGDGPILRRTRDL